MSKQNNTSSSSSGIGFVGLLTILFIALKLTGHIDWSWIWVLSPMWIAALLWIFVFGLVLWAFSQPSPSRHIITKNRLKGKIDE